MKQAFVLPLPKTLSRHEIEESSPDKMVDTKSWQQVIDRLAEKKLDWGETLEKINGPFHPILRLNTTQDSQTLLHLAVLLDQPQSIEPLIHLSPHLKYKANGFGLTPYELSLFLPRKKIAQLLHPFSFPCFASQTNVSIPLNQDHPFSQNIELLAQPLFENERVLQEILIQTRRAKMADLIPAEKIWMGIYFDEEIQKGAHPKVSIQYINDKIQFGVFTEQKIPCCAFVGEYTGVIQERKKRELQGKIYCVRYTVWEMGRRNFIIDAETKGNFTRFINHSAKPNLGLQSVYWRGMPRMIFVALKEIEKGTQLTFDYGHFFWKEQKQTPLVFE
jgi:hypothetical protein